MARPGSVLYVGACYYNTWYLSRELRKLGWKADVLTFPNDNPDLHSHGWDYRLRYASFGDAMRRLAVIAKAALRYDVLHFTGKENLRLLYYLDTAVTYKLAPGAELPLLKRLGKKIVYTVTGCLDGVSQTSFSQWGPHSVCPDCPWRQRPDICSDERNLAWGKRRNTLSDFIVNMGGNRVDYNDSALVHEVPEFFCLDPDVWRPDLEIPAQLRFPRRDGVVNIYHAVGNFDLRTDGATGRNVKSTHIYKPTVERMQEEGLPVEMVFVKDVPNREVRFYQAQSDIVVDMLTFGFFGANVREALMLGKPVICFLRPEWLDRMREEIPDYVDQLPVVSATPETVYAVLKDLVLDADKRRELGRRGREFALKFHSSTVAARTFDRIYGDLIHDRVPVGRAAMPA